MTLDNMELKSICTALLNEPLEGLWFAVKKKEIRFLFFDFDYFKLNLSFSRSVKIQYYIFTYCAWGPANHHTKGCFLGANTLTAVQDPCSVTHERSSGREHSHDVEYSLFLVTMTFKVDVTHENVFFHSNYLSLIFMPVINISLVTKQKCLCQMFL